MRSKVLDTILLAASVCLASATDSDSNTTSTQSNGTSILQLYPSTLKKCLDTCFYNKDCQSVAFTRLANFCELRSHDEPPKERNDKRVEFIHRSEIETRLLGLPIGNPSKFHHTKVCPLSDFTGFQQLGNRNQPGDRVIIGNYGNETSNCTFATFVCGETGEWVQTKCRNEAKSIVAADRHDCGDIGMSGFRFSGIYKISPAGLNDSINVFCDFDDTDGPWTVIQRRVDGSVDFYRNFTEYQSGFGDLRGNFWLGLDQIASISQQRDGKYSLKVILEDNGARFAKYSQFRVLGSSTGYVLQVGGYSGNAGDSLTARHNGRPFTTYDKDMDDSTNNCAMRFIGAWWYERCHDSNLNGKYGDPNYGRGINWYTTTGYYRSATFVTMKIKMDVQVK